MDGFKVIRNGDYVQSAKKNSAQLGVLVSINHVDVSEVTIEKGKESIFVPATSNRIEEYVYILEGALKEHESKDIYKVGDSFYIKDLKKAVYMTALENTKVLYLGHESVVHDMGVTMNQVTKIMTQINEKDQYTLEHSTRVCEWIPKVTEKMNMSSDFTLNLIQAAQYHDVGKLDVSVDILKKPSSLSEEELVEIKGHPTAGRLIAENYNLSRVGKIIEQHHERIDGSGYPYGLSGEDICLEAKIIAVVDSYDAMTSDRPYRAALTKEAAIGELMVCRGRVYHEEIVDVFIEILNDDES